MSVTWREQTIAGLDLRIRDGKCHKCLVMLHGIGSDNTSFDRLAEHLPGDALLITWNAPGYGGSARLDDKFPQAGDYARRLLDLVDGLGLQGFTLVGHSLGTLIATEFAALYPSRAKSLVLLAATLGYASEPGARLPQKAAARLADLGALGPLAFAQSRAPRLMYRPESQPEVRDAAIRAMASIDPASYAQAVHMLACANQTERARDVQIASLVLVGNQDQITPREQSLSVHEALKTGSPGLPHHYGEIGKAGHILHQEQPAAVASRIMEFVGGEMADASKVQA